MANNYDELLKSAAEVEDFFTELHECSTTFQQVWFRRQAFVLKDESPAASRHHNKNVLSVEAQTAYNLPQTQVRIDHHRIVTNPWMDSRHIAYITPGGTSIYYFDDAHDPNAEEEVETPFTMEVAQRAWVAFSKVYLRYNHTYLEKVFDCISSNPALLAAYSYPRAKANYLPQNDREGQFSLIDAQFNSIIDTRQAPVYVQYSMSHRKEVRYFPIDAMVPDLPAILTNRANFLQKKLP